MPKISVLMPAYNSDKFIAEAIESILNQTFNDFECIIINDGSTDNTADIVKKYAKQDKRIKFINNKKNQGLIAVLNQGLDLCRGEYIARMDSDDISRPERFAKQVTYLDTHPDVAVVGGWHKEFGKATRTNVRRYPENIAVLDFVIYGSPMSHPTSMIRTSILREHKIYYDKRYIHAEDYDFWYQISKHAQLHNLQEILLDYRCHGNNVSIASHDIQVKSTKAIKQKIINDLTTIPVVAETLEPMGCETIRRFYLMNCIPIIRIKQYGIIKTKYYLFEKIPLLRIQDKKIYLFEIIKIGHIK